VTYAQAQTDAWDKKNPENWLLNSPNLLYSLLQISVLFNSDSDPLAFLVRKRNHCDRSNMQAILGSGSSILGQWGSGCGSGSGSSVLWWPQSKIKLQLKKFILFWWFAIYLSLGLHKGCPSYRRSLQPSKEKIQHFKRWKFCPFFFFLGHFCPPGSGSGSCKSN
jgi:hypothetical protein